MCRKILNTAILDPLSARLSVYDSRTTVGIGQMKFSSILACQSPAEAIILLDSRQKWSRVRAPEVFGEGQITRRMVDLRIVGIFLEDGKILTYSDRLHTERTVQESSKYGRKFIPYVVCHTTGP